MADAQKTAKGNVFLGLIIGLVIAVIAAVVAFGFMSKNNSPVQTDDFLNEQSQNRDRLNRGFDPNNSLQSKVPIKSFNAKSGSANSSGTDGSENADSNDQNDTDSMAKKATQAKNKLVEVFDEFGDKKLAVKKEVPAEDIDPDELAMRAAKEQKEAQKVADEAKQSDELAKQKKLQQEKAKEAKIVELERQERLEKKQKELRDNNSDSEMSDPIDSIVSNSASTGNLNTNLNNNNTRAKKVENKEDNTPSATFYVQTGAFRNIAQADQQKALLAMQGVQAKISEVDSNGQTLHRVRLGPFNSRQDVQKLERTLEQNNLSYKVIKISE